MVAFGLAEGAGNFVHDMVEREQTHYITGGIPGETVSVELIQSNPAHTNFLERYNCGEREFDDSGRLAIHTLCSVASHAGDQDVYQVTWLGKTYIYSITYVDNR